MTLSPFTTLLRLQVQRSQANPRRQQIRTLLAAIVEECQILYPDESLRSLDVLISSLQNNDSWSPSNVVFEFLDNCILRFVRKPILYIEMFADIIATADNAEDPYNGHVDLLLVTILEQWPFVTKSADVTAITDVGTWLVRYIESSSLRIQQDATVKHEGLWFRLLLQIRERLRNDVQDDACLHMLEQSLKKPPELNLSIDSVSPDSNSEHRETVADTLQLSNELSPQLTISIPPGPPLEQEDHLGLNKWTFQDTQDTIRDGDIEELFLCLCARSADIRKQAITNIGLFMAKLKVTNSGRRQRH